MSYFQGELSKWKAPKQEELYNILPEDRRYAYDVNAIINTIADVDSVLELRTQFAKNMVTALIRIEGKPYGVIANSTRFLGGAIDSDAADKASRFLQLCNAFQLPIISLCDTPGFMVGPEHEAKGLIAIPLAYFKCSSIRVPMITVVLERPMVLGQWPWQEEASMLRF